MKHPVRRILQLLLYFGCLACTAPIHGQSPLYRSFELRENRYKPRIRCMLQDRQGMLWLGTDAGLFYFTGQEFRRPYLSDSIRMRPVSALALDKTGSLWVGTESGIIFQVNHYQQEFFLPEDGFPKVPVSGILETRDGTVFISTRGEGVYYWNGKRLYNVDSDDGLSDNYCYTLAPEPQGGVIAGTDNGISVINILGGKKQIRQIGRRDGLLDDIVRAIIPARGGYWIGFQDGGVLFTDLRLHVPEDSSLQVELSAGQVNALCDLGDELWVGTEASGVQALRERESGRWSKSAGLSATSGSRISALLRDSAGNVWIASGNKLFRSTGSELRLISEYEDFRIQHVHCVMRDRQDRIWFSPDQQLAALSYENGIAKITRYRITQPEHMTDIVALYQDGWGGIWIGTLGEGVFRLDPGTGRLRQIDDLPLLKNASILSISGKDDDLWITGFGGVIHLRLRVSEDGIHYEAVDDPALKTLEGVYIYCSLVDRRGRLWLGSDENGLYRFSGDRLVQYSTPKGLPGSSVLGICEDAGGRIWVNCIDAGVAIMERDSLRAYTLADGLTDLSNTSLLPLPDSSLLVVHASGADRFDPQTGTFFPFHPDEALNDINPDPNATAIDRWGRIWLGTDKGLLLLSPPERNERNFPTTVLEHVIQYSDPIRYWEQQRFAYDENNFRFEFAGLWYADPGRIQYATQLEGLSDKWQFSHEPAAWFSNLAPGSYTLRVRTSLNNRFLRSPELIYHFVVEPPFWKTWWFRIALATGIVGGIWWIIRRRERQLRELEGLEKERIMFQLETLRSQVNPHFLFNSFNTLLNLIEKDPRRAAEYAEQLSDFFRDIVANRDLPQVSLQDELRLLDTYISIQKKRYGESLQVEVEVDPAQTGQLLLPPMSLQLLAENAIKHNIVSREHPLYIRIRLEQEELCVENNLQSRLQHEPSTGLGLENIRRRFSLMSHRPVRIERTEEYFRVTLPLSRAEHP